MYVIGLLLTTVALVPAPQELRVSDGAAARAAGCLSATKVGNPLVGEFDFVAN